MRPQIAMPDNVAPLGASNICNLGDLIGFRMVGVVRIELPATAMSTQCSTTELYAHAFRNGSDQGLSRFSALAAFTGWAGAGL